MLRRLLTALLALSIAVPLPAIASLGACTMDGAVLAASPCNCCDSPALPGSSPCGSGCGCSLKADTGSAPAAVATTPSATVSFAVDSALVPARLAGPQREARALALAASPPGAGAVVSRPMLCSWTL